ncbi:hypothetical protein Y88_0410 [Novosphingobium nitrogenifigens DSM 19370]|uniref:Uncharacterized protein n=1 Tax=Novosphingobium nitrogenifigens DSM 19370 TaxID=983920 RepID=F1ZAK8_9SPHN|nr:hypothetical protein Y88_0410 [Novosphingobium nitrogenifigens DSM 19370]
MRGFFRPKGRRRIAVKPPKSHSAKPAAPQWAQAFGRYKKRPTWGRFLPAYLRRPSFWIRAL